MMHSSDRTLIAQLGFADPDKRDPRHDLACQYLASLARGDHLDSLIEYAARLRDAGMSHNAFQQVSLECGLYKGASPYKSVVGFIDVLVECSGSSRRQVVRDGNFVQEWNEYSRGIMAAIEVKVTPTRVGDVLRQIALYREFRPKYDGNTWAWILATAYPVPSHEVETLHQAGIAHCLLGHSFEHWCEEIGAKPDHGQKQFKF